MPRSFPIYNHDTQLTIFEAGSGDGGCLRAGCSDCKILQLARVEDGDMNDPYFDHEDFAIALDKLSGSAAPGPDGVPAMMLKRGKRTICRILSQIFKTSFDSGQLREILYQSTKVKERRSQATTEMCHLPATLSRHLKGSL